MNCIIYVCIRHLSRCTRYCNWNLQHVTVNILYTVYIWIRIAFSLAKRLWQCACRGRTVLASFCIVCLPCRVYVARFIVFIWKMYVRSRHVSLVSFILCCRAVRDCGHNILTYSGSRKYFTNAKCLIHYMRTYYFNNYTIFIVFNCTTVFEVQCRKAGS